jgi:phospholipase C
MPPRDRSHALDQIVVVLFENRSLDNMLGHLYGPEDGKTFDGVIGKNLSNPVPEWAEHGADRKLVPYEVATDMDAPSPDSGEEWFHTNTQLFNTLDDHNRFKLGEEVAEPWSVPPPGATPTMDGFVTDYKHLQRRDGPSADLRRVRADHDRIHPPEQLPVLSGIARDFGVFDHWFSEVPSQTFMNRSFWTAATSSGIVVNSPVKKWFSKNDAETIFERLEQHGKTWKIYVMEPMVLSFHGIIHYSSADRLGRAGRNLRPRAPRIGPAATPGRTGRRAGLQVRPIRLPRSRDPRLTLGTGRLRVQRRVPPHLADRHLAEEVEPRRGLHPA